MKKSLLDLDTEGQNMSTVGRATVTLTVVGEGLLVAGPASMGLKVSLSASRTEVLCSKTLRPLLVLDTTSTDAGLVSHMWTVCVPLRSLLLQKEIKRWC